MKRKLGSLKQSLKGKCKPPQNTDIEKLKIIRIPHIQTEDGWALPPEVRPTKKQIDDLSEELFGRIRERVFEKLKHLASDQKTEEALVDGSAEIASMLVLIARSRDLNDATTKFNLEVNDGNVSTMDGARNRLIAAMNNFPSEFSIIAEFYKGITSGDDLMDISTRIKIGLNMGD